MSAGSPVPVIDLSPFRLGDEAAQRQVARAVGRACEEIGFLTIVGHGVPEELACRTDEVARRFFALPAGEKLEIRHGATSSKGYSPLAGEGLSYSLDRAAPADLKESLTIGPVDRPGDDALRQPATARFFSPNLWPRRPPELREAFTAYYRAMEGLADLMAQVFALALDLPADHFRPFIDAHISHLKVVHYPPQDVEPLPGQLRSGEHSDYGSFTLLRLDGPPGLQVRDRERGWSDVPFAPGAFVVNLGDLMAQWTNDRWVSTLHRVVNPPRPAAAMSRLSLVFFHQPNADALITPIPTCCGPGRPARYAPVTSGEHLMTKVAKQKAMGGSVPVAEARATTGDPPAPGPSPADPR
jgi:isopenicillin N synthase-like dioxygenase